MGNRKFWSQFLIGFILGVGIALFYVNSVGATAVQKITWCHTEPSGNSQTLELPQAALENAGHVDASGNPLHAGDHTGACVTVSPSVEPTTEVTPTDVPSPTPDFSEDRVSGQSAGVGGDGRTDGLTDGKSSCPECSIPKAVIPLVAPATGRGE